ncbi:hypothetical protein [Rhizobium tubonense]|uniref:hypothetical protein n=1 Tax=Rhizobium tubonense TaxID=484088 RepID=UPI0018A85492|nr:hypothetical protein [Rhizobium tubonense]
MANIYSETAFDTPHGSSSLSAFFDSRLEGEAAIARLEQAGIAKDKIRFMPGYEDSDAPIASNERHGFFDALTDWLFPDDDRAAYAEGPRRGGYLVSVSNVADLDYKTAHDILDDEGSIDLDERADQWRTEGWDPTALDTEVSRGNNGVSSDRDLTNAASNTGRNDSVIGSEGDFTPVVGLRVSNRDVSNGSGKVRAYIVKTPVNDPSTNAETDAEDRRSGDRPLTGDDRAFQDETTSEKERDQEAVVSNETPEIKNDRPQSPAPKISEHASGIRRD